MLFLFSINRSVECKREREGLTDLEAELPPRPKGQKIVGNSLFKNSNHTLTCQIISL